MHAADPAEVEAPIENEVQSSAADADPASAHELEVGTGQQFAAGRDLAARAHLAIFMVD